MKKKTVLKLLFIASCLVAVCSLFYNNENDAHCYGYGSVDCRSYKVKYKISGLSLE